MVAEQIDIVKKRQMMVNRQKDEKLRGVVGVAQSQAMFELKRFFPSDDLKHFIEHYWLISWDLPDGVVHRQQVISHPCVHLTFLKDASTITGIVTQQFEHSLSGQGNLVGVRFTPAGFFAFAQMAGLKMSEITGQVFEVERFFNVDVEKFESEILALDGLEEKTQKLEQILLGHAPELDANVPMVNDMVRQIEADNSLLKVADICQKFNLNERQLQRMFSKYIGISAKWILTRYRIHEALEQIEIADEMNWSDFAVKLGYYDQAHFIKDFKNLIGSAPDGYLKSLK